MKRSIAALCVLVVGATASAQEEKRQPPGGRGGGMFGRFGAVGASYVQDLSMKEVQEDLKLTDDDKAKVDKLKGELEEGDRKVREETRDASREERAEKMTAWRMEAEKKVKEALGDKFARLRQIRLQLDGAFGAIMRDRELRESLSLSEDQTRELREAAMASFQRPEPGSEPPSPEKMREMMEEMQKKQAEAVEKVLTAEQKKKWEEAIGAKIAYKRPPMQPGGRRPGGEKKAEEKPPV